MRTVSLLALILLRGMTEASEPHFLAPMRDVTVLEGRNATFVCRIAHIGKHKIGWLNTGSKAILAIGSTVITPNPRIQVESGDTEHLLTIVDARLEDEGRYMCQLNTKPVISQSGELRVVGPSDIASVSLSSSPALEGTTLRVMCNATGHPRPRVYWMRERNHERIRIFDPRKNKFKFAKRVEGETLILHKVHRSQSGDYLCVAGNGLSTTVSKRVTVNVDFRPEVSTPVKSVAASPGGQAVLECRVQAFPKGSHSWYRDSGEKIPRDALLQLNDESEEKKKYGVLDYPVNAHTVVSRLTIWNVSTDDFGGYVCRVLSDNFGDIEDIVYLANDRVFETTTMSTESSVNRFRTWSDLFEHNNENQRTREAHIWPQTSIAPYFPVNWDRTTSTTTLGPTATTSSAKSIDDFIYLLMPIYCCYYLIIISFN